MPVSSDWVVEHFNIVKDVLPSRFSVFVYPSLNTFTLKELKEAFCNSIVMAVSAPAHAAEQVMRLQKGEPVVAGVLTTLVRMN